MVFRFRIPPRTRKLQKKTDSRAIFDTSQIRRWNKHLPQFVVEKSWPSNRNLSYLEKKNMDVFLVPKNPNNKVMVTCQSPVGPTMGLNDLAKPMPSCAGVGIAPQAKSQGGGFRVVTRVLWFHWLSAFLGLAFSRQQIPATLKVTSLILGLLDGTTKPPPQSKTSPKGPKRFTTSKTEVERSCSFLRGNMSKESETWSRGCEFVC